MLDAGEVIPAYCGGLIVGREGPEDDIPLWVHAGQGVMHVVALMQGDEYLMSPEATAAHMDRLVELNAEKGPYVPLRRVPLTRSSSVINTNFHSPTAGLWLRPGQFIVNRFATRKHYLELERLNSPAGRQA